MKRVLARAITAAVGAVWALLVVTAPATVLLPVAQAGNGGGGSGGAPTPTSVTFDVRRASVGTVALQHTLEWWEYEFAVIDIVFDQPLYLSFPGAAAAAAAAADRDADSKARGAKGHGGSGAVFNESFHPYSHHHASPTLRALHETITLSCAASAASASGGGGAGAGDGGGSYSFVLSTDWPSDYYTNPEALVPLLLPYNSASNPYRSLFKIFDVFGDDDHAGGTGGGAGAGGVRRVAGGTGSGGSSNALTLMLMLAYASPAANKRFVEQSELRSCKLQYLPLDRRAAAVGASGGSGGSGGYEPAHSAGLGAVTNFRGQEVRMNAPLVRSRLPCRHRTVMRLQQYDERSSLASWHAYYATHAPPSLRATTANGTELHPVGAAGGAGPSSALMPSPQALLQTRTEAQLPGILMVFKPIFSGVLKPVVKSTTIYMCDFWIMSFTDKLFHDVINEVVPDLTVMLGTVLDANLTNILSDSITYSVTKSISLGLARTLAPYLSTRVSAAITPRLHSAIHRVLVDKIPLRLRTHVPTIVNRVVQLTLTHALTRSVTHAVVPALTHALPHTKQMNVYCHSCYYHKVDRHCSLCHFSPQSVYYQIYHATFFSDYYSDYYADYYAHTLQEMQTKLWSDVNGEEPSS